MCTCKVIPKDVLKKQNRWVRNDFGDGHDAWNSEARIILVPVQTREGSFIFRPSRQEPTCRATCLALPAIGTPDRSFKHIEWLIRQVQSNALLMRGSAQMQSNLTNIIPLIAAAQEDNDAPPISKCPEQVDPILKRHSSDRNLSRTPQPTRPDRCVAEFNFVPTTT